jgi:hypothetical protein
MRLPQSITQHFSVRLAFIIHIVVALAVILPLSAGAATQSLALSPARLRFGMVEVGEAETQLVVLTNTGTTSATVSTISVSSGEFSVSGLKLPATLAAGQSVTMNVMFAPTETGWTGEQVTLTESSGKLELPVAGTGATAEPLTANPSSLSFGQVVVGKSATQSMTLTNALPKAETLTAFQIAGTGFSVSGPTLPVTLSSGQSITLKVTFTPPAAAVEAGNIFVSGGGVDIPMSGTGAVVGQLSVAPLSVNFGGVQLGSTASEQSTLTATGGSVTITSGSSNQSQFGIGGVSFPLTISAGQSIPFNVMFTPQAMGSASATLSFVSNATNSTAQESATGTGTAPSVGLSWTPSTSQVAGYNVYRGTVVNAYTKINSTLDPGTTYTDTTATPGVTYYYAATSVSSNGEESGYSSPIQVQVP